MQFFYADLSGTVPNTASTTTVGKVVAPSLTADVNTDLSKYTSLALYTELQGCTGGTLDVYLQVSPDCGTTWVDFMHFPQLAGGAAVVTTVTPFANAAATAPVAVGKGTSPALAANTFVGGHPGDRMRVVFKTGAGVTVGTAQVIKLYGVPTV
jgi:hypothetical protein